MSDNKDINLWVILNDLYAANQQLEKVEGMLRTKQNLRYLIDDLEQELKSIKEKEL